MTTEERLSMKKFEAKVRHLIAQFAVLKQENTDLYSELENKKIKWEMEPESLKS